MSVAFSEASLCFFGFVPDMCNSGVRVGSGLYYISILKAFAILFLFWSPANASQELYWNLGVIYILVQFQSVSYANLYMSQACTAQVWADVLCESIHRIQKSSSPAPSFLGFFCLPSPLQLAETAFSGPITREMVFFLKVLLFVKPLPYLLTSAHIWVKTVREKRKINLDKNKACPSIWEASLIPFPNLPNMSRVFDTINRLNPSLQYWRSLPTSLLSWGYRLYIYSTVSCQILGKTQAF